MAFNDNAPPNPNFTRFRDKDDVDIATPPVGVVFLFWDGTNFRYKDSSGSFTDVGGGGGTPGGADTQVQFNDGGVFGGEAGLVYAKATDALTVVGSVTSPHHLASGNRTLNSWLTAGVGFAANAATYTDDNTASGTVATRVAHSLGIPTFAQSAGAHTVTDVATLYIAGVPAAGAGVTLTNSYAIWVDAGASRFDGALRLANGTAGSPSLSFQSATNTGIYWDSTPAVFISIGGAGLYEFQSSFFRFYGNLRPGNDVSQDIGTQAVRVRTYFGGGGMSAGIASKTTTYTATANDYVLLCDATSGAFDIDLPAAASHTGRIYRIKKIDSSANAVSIDPNSTELIDGSSTSYALSTQWQSIDIVSNGTSWFIL